jgi:hypothetical protein
MWISAAFHLTVIRAFDALVTGEHRSPPIQISDDLKTAIVAAMNQRQKLPRLEFPKPPANGSYKYNREKPYPRDARTIETAKDIAIAIRNWLRALPDEQAREDLKEAAHTLYELLIAGWTEVDEALCSISTGVHYLNRWQGRGGRMGNVGP